MGADIDKLLAIEQEMAKAIQALDSLKSSAAMARQVTGLRDDRIKAALARLVTEFLNQDMSASAAEWRARSDERFKREVQTIMAQTASAQAILNDWELQKLKFDSARSLLSTERSLVNLV